jgi:hypothetical protein
VSSRPGRWAFLIVGFLLAGCSNWVWPDQPSAASPEPAALTSATSWGQTFVALESGLAGIDVYLLPVDGAAASGEVSLHLRADPDSTVDIAAAALPLAAVTQPNFYHFEFPPQAESQRRAYFVVLELAGDGSAQVGRAAGDAYEHGSLYQNGEPVDAQMAFRLGYDPAWVARGVLADGAAWLGWLTLALFLFVLPGWALLAALWPGVPSAGWPEKLGLAVGLSLALYPVLFLWTHVIGLHLGPGYAWLPPLAGLAVLGAAAWRRRQDRPAPGKTKPIAEWLGSTSFWPNLAFVAVFALIVLTRFWAVRNVALPMWGDSYQHSVITQLLVDHGGLFDSWQPYAGLQTFTYHFGFHSLVAVFHWLSRLPAPQAVLWFGQLLNCLSLVALYPLATRVGRSPWAGIAAMALAGLLSPMPMFYTDWGRYTQLAGQAILPTACYFAWEQVERPKWDWRLLGLATLAFSGLALTHYRILIFAAIFLAAALLLNWRQLRRMLPRVAALGAASGLLFLPWFWHAYGGRMMTVLVAQVTTPPSAISAPAESNFATDLLLYPAWWWLMTILALAVGLWRRNRAVLLVAVWWALILLAANPKWVGLPGDGVLTDFTVLIAMYLPAAILVGSAVAGWIGPVPRWGAAACVVILGLGLWGARSRLTEIRTDRYALATWADVRAADWIKTNLPLEARFLVNSLFAYGDRLVAGSDGGWWLPLLARRSTNLPPLNYSLERGDQPDYRVWVNAVPEAIRANGVADAAVLQLLAEREITHVYVGQKQGRVNYGGPDDLAPQVLLASPNFRPVYHEDRVWIFEVVQNP